MFFKLKFLCLFFVTTFSLHAALVYDLNDFEKEQMNTDAGYVMVDGHSFFKLGFSPDFKLGLLDTGLDLTLYIPLSGQSASSQNLDFFALRHIGINYKDRYGIKWGRLKNVTLGYGLLMNQYDSGSRGHSEFTTSKAGALGFVSFLGARADVMYTASQVEAGRFSYTFTDTPIKLPVRLGGTIVQDMNGIDAQDGDISIQRAKQQGYAIDMAIPISDDLFTIFSEYAELKDQGKGASLGVLGTLSGFIDYRLEYRRLGERFVPGYFNTSYEATSFNFDTDAPSKSESGFLGSLNLSLMDDYVKAGAMIEAYDDRKLGSVALGWQKIANTVGVVNYSIPFQGRKNATLRADVLVLSDKPFNYVIGFKRIYSSINDYEDFYTGSVRVDLGKFFPSLPF